MKNKKNIFLISLLIILSLSLLMACKAETPSPAAESLGEAPKVEPPQESPKAEALAEAPANPKSAEPEKPAEAASKSTAESTKETKNDKTFLQIEGSGIEKPTTLTLDELKAIKDAYIEDDFFSLNSYGTKEYFSFKGVKLSAILEKAGLKKNAETIKFIASDGYEQEITIGQALKEDYIDEQNPDKKYPVIIAWHENGQDYDAEKGAPFRLVIGQKEPGDVNKPQWVQNIAKIIVD